MSWVAWSLALLIGFAILGAQKGLKFPSVPSATDGTYVYEASSEERTFWMRVVLKGDRASATTSLGDLESYRVERRGDTLRFIDTGSTAGASRVDLATIVDNGQALDLELEGTRVKFVRQ